MLQWNGTFRMKIKIFCRWKIVEVFKGYMIPVRWWRRKKGRSQHMWLPEAPDNWGKAGWETEKGPQGRVELWQLGGCYFFTVVLKKHFPSLRFVYCSLSVEENHCSFCAIKGLNIMKKEVTYPRLMHYTAAFVLKQLCHSEGGFMFCSLSGELNSSMTLFILGDYSVFTFFANGRLCMVTCPFLSGDLANSETLVFYFFKMSELCGRKTIFWTSEVCFCLDYHPYLFSNLEVGRFFKILLCE